MNRAALLLGALLAVAGAVMYLLLGQLATVTFRADRSIWFDASYLTIALGAALVLMGSLGSGGTRHRTDIEHASGFFSRLALMNLAAAALFALPVLLPSLEFPILITRWPGIYMVVAYTFFIVVGVLGNVAWASILTNFEKSDGLGSVVRWQLIIQLVLTQLGVYAFSAFMFLGGYIGASLDYGGAQAGLVGIAMEFTVVPTALSIFGIIVGELLGVANIVTSLRNRTTTASRTSLPSRT